MSMIQLPGRVTITRPHGPGEPCISIKIADRISGLEIVEVHIGLAAFADATVGSLAHTPCEIEYNNDPNIGKVAERKTLAVFIPRGNYEQDVETARAAIAPFEVDGWKCSHLSTAFNHHYATRQTPPEGQEGSWQSMSFVRYVDAGPENADE